MAYWLICRYVALNTLTKISAKEVVDPTTLQRHRSTVLDCLRDPDISIRRRALDLSFYLITPSNIRILTRELLSFLEVCEPDIKSSVATRICEVAGRYRPNKRWETDTIIRVLRVAGGYVDQGVINTFVKLVSTGLEELQGYAARKLFFVIKEGEAALVQEGLLIACVWGLGEYGDYVVRGVGLNDGDDEDGEEAGYISERDILDMFDGMLRGPYATGLVKEYAVTALVKLTCRVRDEGVQRGLKELVMKYRTSMDMELQQRAVEYTTLWALSKDERLALLERVPMLESAVREEELKGRGGAVMESEAGDVFAEKEEVVVESVAPADDILGLMFGGSGSSNANVVNSGVKNVWVGWLME
jgi:AP-1 complex subunit gamma-1